jgi:hypothetical protein
VQERAAGPSWSPPATFTATDRQTGRTLSDTSVGGLEAKIIGER